MRSRRWLWTLPALWVAAAGCDGQTGPRLYQATDRAPTISEDEILGLEKLGPTLVEVDGVFKGVNFGVYSARAEKVQLLLFDDPESNRATRTFDMVRFGNDVWNLYVEGVGLGQHYGYVAFGPNWTYDEQWFPGSIKGFKSDVDSQGNRFNPNKLLFDPYCKVFNRDHDWGKGSAGTGPYRTQQTYGAAMKCRVVKSSYQWGAAEDDWRLKRQQASFPGHNRNELILYEVHAKGFTASPASGVDHPGSYRGFGEKADYLAELGVTAVELMPVFEKPLDGGYWGYQTLNFFAPEQSYAFRREQSQVIDEFKWMVEELHKRGIEVILDVVYNHTGEGGLWREKIKQRDSSTPDNLINLDSEEVASIYSYRGLDNAAYYALSFDGRTYWNNTGVGQDTRCNARPFQKLILDSLHYWVEEMHVDGFRFDLAPVLGEKDGDYNNWDDVKKTVLQKIADDPVLQKYNTRIVAEPWAAGGPGMKLGAFPSSSNKAGEGWGEWNGHFRDWWRSFLNQKGEKPTGGVTDDANWVLNTKVGGDKGDDGGAVVTGSSALFSWNGRRPYHSINFITVHDGFTLYDLTSYDKKRNECSPLNSICCTSPTSPFCDIVSGEDNNRSRNWGDVVGNVPKLKCDPLPPGPDKDACYRYWYPWADQNKEPVKRQVMRGAFAAMLLSQGTPMLYGGDEWLRTQLGNNNAYTTQADNEYNWFDWGSWEARDEKWRMFDFVKKLVSFRKSHGYALAPEDYGKGAHFTWKSPSGGGANWGSKSLMLHYDDPSRGPELLVLINMEGSVEIDVAVGTNEVPFTLPALSGNRKWVRRLDTQRAFDMDNYAAAGARTSSNIDLDGKTAVGSSYGVKTGSIVVLEAVP